MSLNLNMGESVFSVELTTDKGVTHLLSPESIEYVYLVEDMFSSSITGRIQFYDRIGLIELGPVNGNEVFTITFGNTNGSGKYRSIDMKIHKINDIKPISDNIRTESSLVDLILVDTYYQKLHSNGWSKAWVDTRISDIIEDICEHHLGIESLGLIEKSNEILPHFDTHMRTPAECIVWLMNRASSAKSGQPGYMFYRYNDNNIDNFPFALTTLESLLSNKKYMKPMGDDYVYIFDSRNHDYINKVGDFKIRHVDLTALKSLSGGSIMGFDSQRKKLLRQDNTYLDAVDRFTILGRKTLFPSDMLIERPKIQIDGYVNEDILDNIWFGNWIREYCHQQLVELNVQGHEDRHVGGMIRILWSSADSRGEVLNRQMDGKYLVKSITHYLSPNISNGYRQKLTCIKNGYGDSSNSKLVKSKKINV